MAGCKKFSTAGEDFMQHNGGAVGGKLLIFSDIFFARKLHVLTA
jgi:hypothetical protein